MKNKEKKIMMNKVCNGTLREVREILQQTDLVSNNSYFDYELLKAALKRKHQGIANYLIITKGCRVVKPNRRRANEDTPIHLATGLNKFGFLQRLLSRGATIYDKNHLGDIPILTAFKKGNFCAVEDILQYCSRLRNFNPNNRDDLIHFHIACITDNLKCVQVFVGSGFDINSPISIEVGEDCDLNNYAPVKSISLYPGMTPLHFVCMYGFQKLIQFFLDQGADCNRSDNNGKTPLHGVILGNCELENDCLENSVFNEPQSPEVKNLRKKMIKLLLDKGANVHAADNNGCTPLHAAFYYANSDKKEMDKKYILDFLLANVEWGPTNITDNQGLSYFHIACSKDDMHQVKEFLIAGANVNSRVTSGMYKGYAALHFAVLFNQDNIVRLLLEWNARVNLKTVNSQSTPLHLACEFNYVKLHELHLKHDSKRFDAVTITMFYIESFITQLRIIKYLIDRGANMEAKDSLGRTPLLCTGLMDFNLDSELLAWSDSFKKTMCSNLSGRMQVIIEILVSKYGANVSVCGKNKSSILHSLSEYYYFKIRVYLIKILVENGLDVNTLNNDGLTPLHIAVKCDNKRMVQNLLECNANVNAESEDSLIPLQMTELFQSVRILECSSDKRDIFCLLLEYGSRLDVMYENGKSFLSVAISERNVFVVEKLLDYGADISMRDSSGETTTSHLKWNFSNTFFQLVRIIYVHVQRLLALGRNVCEKVRNTMYEISVLYSAVRVSDSFRTYKIVDVANVPGDCIKELDDMKLIKIDKYTSLYKILQKDDHEISKHIKNRNFTNIVNDENIQNRFPIFGTLLKIQLRKGQLRSQVLESAESSLDYITGMRLNDYCSDAIFKHLTNQDIITLKRAASGRN